ncbi:MAG: hypothetical protein LBV32_01935 [Tannerellaceae bacterium]|nr:hypothetical protein [Tannerellaceae bacterium]
MQQDLALLPLWYGEAADYVWVDKLPDLSDFNFQPHSPRYITRKDWEAGTHTLPPLTAAPWGLSPQVIRFFEKLRKASPGRELLVPRWKEEYRELTNRKTAAACLKMIKDELPGVPLPDLPLFVSSLGEIEDYISRNRHPFMIKTPFSSSGRGLLRINAPLLTEKEKDWISGALRKQQFISIEKYLEKTEDFAMEFYLDENGKATYRGLSVFTTRNGAYSGNILESQSRLEQRLSSFNFQFSIINYQLSIARAIESFYGGRYSGYLGVDMMIYKTEEGQYAVHPCVEINMRYTMGMVAIRLFEQYIHPEASGYFRVVYEKEARQEHLQMTFSHPPRYENGRLLEGYLPLCPVTPETRYRAFVLIER